MPMPSIAITFTEVAATAVKRGEKGIIAMIIKDALPEVNPIICVTEGDVPETLSLENQIQIKNALKGYVNAPLRVIAYVLPASATNYSEAFDCFKTVKFDYLVVPTAETDEKKADIVSYVKNQRANGKLIKAVLPNIKADSEAIINYTTAAAYEDGKAYTAEEFCSRIAGIIAGTPLSISCTYAPIPEITDCTRLDKTQMDKAVDDGEFIIWFDGEKVKTARAVNSLTTFTDTKNTQFQKVKIVDAIDMIGSDIRMTAEDSYLGKYANTYDNKCLLISAIGNYFDELIKDNVVSSYQIGIDVDANRAYLKGKGKDVDSMTEAEIKQANTGSNVFLKATVSILDAIEDITLPITI